jgi:hypothetical protein
MRIWRGPVVRRCLREEVRPGLQVDGGRQPEDRTDRRRATSDLIEVIENAQPFLWLQRLVLENHDPRLLALEARVPFVPPGAGPGIGGA